MDIPQRLRREIEQLEDRLRSAILAGDVDGLDRLIGDAAVYTDQAGRRVSKAADLAAYRAGLEVDRFDRVDGPVITLLGDTAIVNLVVDVAGRQAGSPFAARLAYTRVWHRRDGEWRVAAAHSSAVAD